ncbi:cac, partial [Symbiodinium microadriaticum]
MWILPGSGEVAARHPSVHSVGSLSEMHHDVAAFQRTLDEAWASFREQLVQVHLEYVQHDPVHKADEGKSTGAVRPRHPTVQDDVPSIKGPPQSMMPELLISRPLPPPQTVMVDGDQPESASKAAETAEFVDSKLYLESGEEEGPTTGNPGPMCATLTDQTSSSIKEHVEQTLRMRLGTTKKLISGQELHDAVVALGLTRYSQSDVNAIVNKLAHFVRLRFEPIDKKAAAKLQHSGTFSRMIGLRRDGSLSTSSREVRIDERSRAIWEWPQEGAGSVADFLRSNLSEGMSPPQHNVVPFQALAMAFAMDGDGKRIFGTSAELFRAIKEILLAGDTNRLVAELTFVRINDLAAPTQPVDPVLYIEPFVALLIVSNAFILGVQTDENWESWAGWQWIEVAFTLAFCLEIVVRIRLVGLRTNLSGPESTWNYFDMFLVLAGLIDILLTAVIAESEAAAMQLLRACRLVRLTRTFRVFRLKMIKELQLMIKGLVGGLRTLCLAFALLFSVLYVIAVFATIAIGRAELTPPLDHDIQSLFATVPDSIFTAFRCYTGECTAEGG